MALFDFLRKKPTEVPSPLSPTTDDITHGISGGIGEAGRGSVPSPVPAAEPALYFTPQGIPTPIPTTSPSPVPAPQQQLQGIDLDRVWEEASAQRKAEPKAEEGGKMHPLVRAVLAPLEPLMFIGDAVKAIIYGAATRGVEGAVSMLGEMIRRAPTYAPGGKMGEGVVSGEDIARLFLGDNLDRASPLGRWAITFAADVMTDPLTFFWGAGLATRLAGKAVRGVGALTRAAPLEQLGEAAIRFADGVIAPIDTLAQRTLNPYAIGVGMAKAGIGAVAAMRGRTYEEFAGSIIESILDAPLPLAREKIPLGLQKTTLEGEPLPKDIPLRVRDLIYPRRFTEFGIAGSPETGPSYYALAKTLEQELKVHAVREVVQPINALLREELGVRASILGIAQTKLLHPSAEALIREMMRRVNHIVGNYGLDERAEALEKAYRDLVKVLPEVTQGLPVEVTPDKLRRLLFGTEEIIRKGTLYLTYKLTGFDKFLDEALKPVAEERGMDPASVLRGFSRLAVKYSGRDKELAPGEARQLLEAPRDVRERGAIPSRADDYLFPGLVRDLPPGVTFNKAQASRLLKAEKFSPFSQEAVGPYKEWLGYYASDLVDVIPDTVYRPPEDIFATVLYRGEPTRTIKPKDADRLLAEATKGIQSRDLHSLLRSINYAAYRLDNPASLPEIDEPIKKLASLVVKGRWYEAHGRLEKAAEAFKAAQDLVIQIDKVDAARYYIGTKLQSLGVKPPEGAVFDPIRDGLDILRAPNPTTITGQDVINFFRFMSRLNRDVLKKLYDELQETKGDYNVWQAMLFFAINRRPSTAKSVLNFINNYGTPDAQDAFMNILRRAYPDEITDLIKKGAIRPTPAMQEEIAAREAWQRFLARFPHWPKEYSPHLWMQNLANGYIRRSLLSYKDPAAAIRLVKSGRFSLIGEINDNTINALSSTFGLDAEAAAKLAEEIHNLELAGQRLVPTGYVLALVKKYGGNVPDDPAELAVHLSRILVGDRTSDLVQNIFEKARRKLPGGERPLRHPKVFAERLPTEAVQKLIDLADPVTNVLDLYVLGAKEARRNELIYRVYQTIREAEQEHKVHYILERGETGYAKIPNNADVYGPFAGKWIPEPLAIDLFRELAVITTPPSPWERLMALFRANLLNWYDSTVRNMVGSFLMLDASLGTNFAMDALGMVPKIMAEMAAYERTGQRGPLLKSVPSEWIYTLSAAAAHEQIFEQLSNIFGTRLREVSTVDRLVDAFKKLTVDLSQNLNIGGFKIGPLGLFSATDDAMRMATYITAVRRGIPEHEALWLAQNVLGNYAETPAAIRHLRDKGFILFPTFTMLAIGKTVRAAVENPRALLSVAKLQESSWASTDPHERKVAQVAMHDWLKSALPVVLPFRLPDGSLAVAPITGFTPYAVDSEDLLRAILGGGIISMLADFAIALQSGEGKAPIASKYGRGEIFDPNDPPERKFAKIMDAFSRAFGPAFVTRFFGTPMDVVGLLKLEATGNPVDIKPYSGPLMRAVATYTHPDVVKALEDITGRDYGITPLEVGLRSAGLPVRELDLKNKALRALAAQLEGEITRMQDYYTKRLIASLGNPNEVAAIKREMATKLNDLQRRLLEVKKALYEEP